jgi:hypothetical protein
MTLYVGYRVLSAGRTSECREARVRMIPASSGADRTTTPTR